VPVGEQPAAARTAEEAGLILSIAGLMQTARFHPCGRLLLPVALSGCRPLAAASGWPAGRARQQRPPSRACSPSSTRPRGWLPLAEEGWGWQKVQGGAGDGEETYDFVGGKRSATKLCVGPQFRCFKSDLLQTLEDVLIYSS